MTDTVASKKAYVKPEVKSETLGPEVLFCTGSPVSGDQKWLKGGHKPFPGFCCENPPGH
jgi:hypothetical protein